MPRWEYIIGVLIILLLIGMAWQIGVLRGLGKGEKNGYKRGYAHGREATKREMLRDPFVARPQFPPRPRPNSAGTVKVHKARIRGDIRPFDQRPDQLIYPRTRMTRPENFDDQAT